MFSTKQDLQLNFGTIDTSIDELYRFMRALEDMQLAVDRIETTLQSSSSGKAIDALLEQKIKMDASIDWYKEQINDLYEILRDYSGQMQSHIRPQSHNQMMRVDRADIYWNLQQIEQTIPDRLNVVASADYIYTTELNWEVREEMSYERNYNIRQLEAMEDDVKALRRRLMQKVHDMDIIFNNHIAYFEDADDDYRARAKGLYSKYTNIGEFLVDGVKNIIQSVESLVKGGISALWEFITGITELVGGVVYYIICGVVVLVTKPFGVEAEWAQTYFNQVNETLAALFNDPNLLIEGILQNASDSYDEKGIFYCMGYVVTDWYLIDKGLEKILKALAKAEDISEIQKLINQLEKMFPGKKYVENPFDEYGNLLPNVIYYTGEFGDHLGITDDLGRLIEIDVKTLKISTASRPPHNPNTPGKQPGDHAGHIIADMFGGSPELDNLVSQLSQVNKSGYYAMENIWKKALAAGQEVKVEVKIFYEADGLRPIRFEVEYWIDGIKYKQKFNNT